MSNFKVDRPNSTTTFNFVSIISPPSLKVKASDVENVAEESGVV